MIELTLGENGIEGIIYGSMGKITSRTTYASEDNIPAVIRSKLSVLKLLQDVNEIPNVGQRVSNTVYWIFDGLEEGNYMSRFDGYNRHDFHHPRTTREAFGSGFAVDKPTSMWRAVIGWVGYITILLAILGLITGVGHG
jgi:hypothetical protein